MRRFWFSTHKWAGLVIGLQVMAWVVSGLFMTSVPIGTVRGEPHIRPPVPVDLRSADVRGIPLKLLRALPGVVTRLELASVNGNLVWRVDMNGKPGALIDDATARVISPLDETTAREIATSDFSGFGVVTAAVLLEANPPIEYRGDLPVWKLELNDADQTHIYVSPLSGKVVARRTSTWRIYDFLWSLHIMDYRTRDDFNNMLVIITAAGALILTISGFGILFYRMLLPRL
mgnify:CR=1 FL=1